MAYKNQEDARAATKRHYESNKAAYLERTRLRREHAKQFLIEIRQGLECCRCGYGNPVTLDFHNRDPEKEKQLDNAANKGWSDNRVRAAIAECDVLCANCHRIVHHTPL